MSSKFSAAAPAEEAFEKFLNRTAPREEDIKDSVFDKNAGDMARYESQYVAAHISIAPPEEKLGLTLRDRRSQAMPSSLKSLDVLDKPLRSLEKGGKAPFGHPSQDFYDEAAARAPPQPIPAATQKLETEFLETIETALRERNTDDATWSRYAKRAEELLITMPLEKVLRVLKAFVLARHQGPDVYTLIGGELAKEVRSASSTRLCQVLHWLGRAGLRDQTLMTLLGNEVIVRLSDDFVLDMYIEVLNVHAKLDIRSPRLINAVLRDVTPLFKDFSRDQVCAMTPLAVISVLSDEARVAYLSRCADLGIGQPARMTRPAILRQFRLLEDSLRLDYHPCPLPAAVHVWLANLKADADRHDIIEPAPLTHLEEDIMRVLKEEMDIAVTPALQDGILTLHLVMGKTVLEVLSPHGDYYISPAMGGQKLLRADTKLRQRLLWRRGWRVLTVDEDEWSTLTADIFKKDFLEAVLTGASRKQPALEPYA